MTDLSDEDLALLESEVLSIGGERGGRLRAALSELRGHRAAKAAGAKRVRDVVRAVFAQVSDLSGAEFAQRHIEDIATRVATQLTGPGEGSPAWRAGIEASIRHLDAMARKPRDLWQPAYFAAVDDALVRLRAMLERGTDRSTTPVAELEAGVRARNADLKLLAQMTNRSRTRRRPAACARCRTDSSRRISTCSTGCGTGRTSSCHPKPALRSTRSS